MHAYLDLYQHSSNEKVLIVENLKWIIVMRRLMEFDHAWSEASLHKLIHQFYQMFFSTS